ncbi:MAG: hypothetical protein LUG85_05840 [Clostridiales bacterium]|nr:hypothetical protein [Clostridiales bacterium]
MKKKNKIIVALAVLLALILAAGLYFGIQILFPFSFNNYYISVTDVADDNVLQSHIRLQYGDYTVYSNADCSFSSEDYSDYCVVDIWAEVTNKSVLKAWFKYFIPAEENDFIIYGTETIKYSAVDAGETAEVCGTSFVCLRNGMTDDTIIKKLSQMKFTAVYKNDIFENLKTTKTPDSLRLYEYTTG